MNLHDVGHIASHLAHHPKKIAHHSGTIATSVIASTIAGVGTYQLNSHIARKQGTPAPMINPISGTSPSLDVQGAAQNVHHKYNSHRKDKGGN